MVIQWIPFVCHGSKYCFINVKSISRESLCQSRSTSWTGSNKDGTDDEEGWTMTESKFDMMLNTLLDIKKLLKEKL
jgi:hypothetical protein